MTNAYNFDMSMIEVASSNWKRKPLWALMRRHDVIGYPEAELLSVYRDYGVIPKSSRADNFNKPSKDLASYQYVRPGDLVLNKMKTWQGSLGVSQYEGIVSPAYFVCGLSGEVYGKFLHYLLRSKPYIHIYQALSKGIRPNQWDLPFDEFKNVIALLPPRDEQRRIADFLDAETARIDRAGNLQERILTTLEEREQAHLDIAVDDLVEECGSAPLRRFVWSVDQGASPQCDAVPAKEGEWGVLKVSCLRPGTFLPHENKRLPKDVTPHRESEVREGDLLITRANTPELVGSTSVVHKVRSKLLLSDKIFRVRLSSGMSPDFVATVARGSRIRALCASSSNGASQSMANIRFEEVKAWPMPLANTTQQENFVVKIAQNRLKVEEIKPRIESQLELLAERRQALITAAVTGQFDVSTASGRGVME